MECTARTDKALHFVELLNTIAICCAAQVRCGSGLYGVSAYRSPELAHVAHGRVLSHLFGLAFGTFCDTTPATCRRVHVRSRSTVLPQAIAAILTLAMVVADRYAPHFLGSVSTNRVFPGVPLAPSDRSPVRGYPTPEFGLRRHVAFNVGTISPMSASRS